MLCMICNTNHNTVKCTTPNKHGFAYVIHYDNNGEALHKHYRFIANDELPIISNESINLNNVISTIETQSQEKNGSFEPNENDLQEKWGFNESRNGSNEPIFDSSNSSSDNVSDNWQSTIVHKRKRRVPIGDSLNVQKGEASGACASIESLLSNVVPTEDNML